MRGRPRRYRALDSSRMCLGRPGSGGSSRRERRNRADSGLSCAFIAAGLSAAASKIVLATVAQNDRARLHEVSDFTCAKMVARSRVNLTAASRSGSPRPALARPSRFARGIRKAIQSNVAYCIPSIAPRGLPLGRWSHHGQLRDVSCNFGSERFQVRSSTPNCFAVSSSFDWKNVYERHNLRHCVFLLYFRAREGVEHKNTQKALLLRAA